MTLPKRTYERSLNDDYLRLHQLQTAPDFLTEHPDGPDRGLGDARHRDLLAKSLQGETNQLRRRLASNLAEIERTGTFLA